MVEARAGLSGNGAQSLRVHRAACEGAWNGVRGLDEIRTIEPYNRRRFKAWQDRGT
jgi:hypothetical protein